MGGGGADVELTLYLSWRRSTVAREIGEDVDARRPSAGAGQRKQAPGGLVVDVGRKLPRGPDSQEAEKEFGSKN